VTCKSKKATSSQQHLVRTSHGRSSDSVISANGSPSFFVSPRTRKHVRPDARGRQRMVHLHFTSAMSRDQPDGCDSEHTSAVPFDVCHSLLRSYRSTLVDDFLSPIDNLTSSLVGEVSVGTPALVICILLSIIIRTFCRALFYMPLFFQQQSLQSCTSRSLRPAVPSYWERGGRRPRGRD